VISGFALYGIVFEPVTPGARLYVSDAMIRRSGASGILVWGAGKKATIDSVRLHQNARGIYVLAAEVTIRDTSVSGSAFDDLSDETSFGFGAYDAARIVVEDSESTNHRWGFYAHSGTVMTISRCHATSNTYGALTQGISSSTIYISESTIVANGTGVSTLGGSVLSRGNNTLQANATNGSFSGTFPPN
jgi:nitrous oxidase accessory protein NosD